MSITKENNPEKKRQMEINLQNYLKRNPLKGKEKPVIDMFTAEAFHTSNFLPTIWFLYNIKNNDKALKMITSQRYFQKRIDLIIAGLAMHKQTPENVNNIIELINLSKEKWKNNWKNNIESWKGQLGLTKEDISYLEDLKELVEQAGDSVVYYEYYQRAVQYARNSY